jgi:hypothetical protein
LARLQLQGRDIKHIGRLKQDRVHKEVACGYKNHIKTDKSGLVAVGNYPDAACETPQPSPRMGLSFNLDRI